MSLDVSFYADRKNKLVHEIALHITNEDAGRDREATLAQYLLLFEDHYFSNVDVKNLRPTLINVLKAGKITSVFEFILVTSEYIYFSGSSVHPSEGYLLKLAENYLIENLSKFESITEMMEAMLVSTFPYMLDNYIYENDISLTGNETNQDLLSLFLVNYREVQFFNDDLKNAIVNNCLDYLERVRPTESPEA